MDGSRLRRASQPHNRVMIGAKITIDSGLKFCVCGADSVNSPNTLSSVLRSANRVRLDPACSNNVQNTPLKLISPIAPPIIWISTLLPLAHDKLSIAAPTIRNAPNRNFHYRGSVRIRQTYPPPPPDPA